MSKEGFKIKWPFTFVIKYWLLALVPWRSLLTPRPAVLCLLLPWLSWWNSDTASGVSFLGWADSRGAPNGK